jgi:HEAT repeat protein
VETVRRAAIEQLPRFDDPRAWAAISDALARETPGVRGAAARALAYAPASAALPKLAVACTDRDPWVRYHAARSLGRFERADARDALLALAMHDALPPVRIAAVEALAELGDADAVVALRPLADDAESAVAAPALLALGAAKDRGTLDALLDALTHADRVRRLAASRALAQRADPSAVPALLAVARNTGDTEERELELAALAATNDERAVASLVELAREPRLCRSVVHTLGRLPESRLPWLRQALAHDDVAVRLTVIEALGQMRHRSAGSLLAEALESTEPAVAAAAAHALAQLDLRATTG